MATSLLPNLLTTSEAALNGGYNEYYVVTADQLTTTATNTAQVLNLSAIAINDHFGVNCVSVWVKTPFQNTADNTFNNTAVTVGDTGSATRFTASQQTNAYGTPVTFGFGPATAIAATVYASAANTLQITFNSMAAQALNSLNVGELWVFVRRVRLTNFINARGKEPILTK